MKTLTTLTLATAAMTGFTLTAVAGGPPPESPSMASEVTTTTVMPSMPSNALVQLTGNVSDKDRDTVWIQYGNDIVKANAPDHSQWYEIYERDAVDAMQIGEPVTVYGRLKSDPGQTPELEAHAFYVPAVNTTFFTESKDRLARSGRLADQYGVLEQQLASVPR